MPTLEKIDVTTYMRIVIIQMIIFLSISIGGIIRNVSSSSVYELAYDDG